MTAACTPKTCCTCQDEPDTRDACMCGCGYLNGIGPVIGSQMLVLIGLFFSLAALGDCNFVALGERLFLPDDLDVDLPIEVTQTQYIGFLTWQKLDGTCYWYNQGGNPENQVEKYFDLLGNDWNIARVLGGLAASLGFYLFCYLLSFVCSSQVRGVRYFNSFFMCCVLTSMQGLTFLVFDSEICEELGCTFSRSAGFSMSSMLAYFAAGVCFLMTKDYPGDRAIGSEKEVAIVKDLSTDVEDGVKKDESPDDAIVHEEPIEDEEEVEEEVTEEEEEEHEVVDEYHDEEIPETEKDKTVTTGNTAKNNLQSVNSTLKDAEA